MNLDARESGFFFCRPDGTWGIFFALNLALKSQATFYGPFGTSPYISRYFLPGAPPILVGLHNIFRI